MVGELEQRPTRREIERPGCHVPHRSRVEYLARALAFHALALSAFGADDGGIDGCVHFRFLAAVGPGVAPGGCVPKGSATGSGDFRRRRQNPHNRHQEPPAHDRHTTAVTFVMELSVLIPTFGRPAKVAACVQRLARQTMDAGQFEVLVGIDGGIDDPAAAGEVEDAILATWPTARAGQLAVVPCPKVGQAAVRNALLERAQGSTLVFLNDDMLPEPTLLEHHVEYQRDAAARGRPALVVGASPWVVPEHDTLFDRLVRETSMVFFYDRMDEALADGSADRDHDWGFRHAWLLNLSAPSALVREAGAFSVFPSTYGYEDDELAFRCRERFGTRVLYRPDAVAHHDHRLTPGSYLDRERRLGFSAWGFAGAAPECAREMFGRDIRCDDEIAYSAAFVEREQHNAERLRTTILDFAELPGDGVPSTDHPAGLPVVRALAEQHLLLKRWEWRRGLLEAVRAEAEVPIANG